MALWIIGFTALTGFILYFCRRHRKIKNDLRHIIEEKDITLEKKSSQLKEKSSQLKEKSSQL
ncbi:MAG: hypothetical protein ACTSWY_10400, partial [Promethearchaeota archaeon]